MEYVYASIKDKLFLYCVISKSVYQNLRTFYLNMIEPNLSFKFILKYIITYSQ